MCHRLCSFGKLYCDCTVGINVDVVLLLSDNTVVIAERYIRIASLVCSRMTDDESFSLYVAFGIFYLFSGLGFVLGLVWALYYSIITGGVTTASDRIWLPWPNLTKLSNVCSGHAPGHVSGVWAAKKLLHAPSLVCGVPQRSVLGPVLFVMYTVDLIQLIANHGLVPQLYAKKP